MERHEERGRLFGSCRPIRRGEATRVTPSRWREEYVLKGCTIDWYVVEQINRGLLRTRSIQQKPWIVVKGSIVARRCKRSLERNDLTHYDVFFPVPRLTRTIGKHLSRQLPEAHPSLSIHPSMHLTGYSSILKTAKRV